MAGTGEGVADGFPEQQPSDNEQEGLAGQKLQFLALGRLLPHDSSTPASAQEVGWMGEFTADVPFESEGNVHFKPTQ